MRIQEEGDKTEACFILINESGRNDMLIALRVAYSAGGKDMCTVSSVGWPSPHTCRSQGRIEASKVRAGKILTRSYRMQTSIVLLRPFCALFVLLQVVFDAKHAGASLEGFGLCWTGLPTNHID